jgi:hypothetical protein
MEHDGHEDLCGSCCWSIRPYVHGEDCYIVVGMALFKAELNLLNMSSA